MNIIKIFSKYSQEISGQCFPCDINPSVTFVCREKGNQKETGDIGEEAASKKKIKPHAEGEKTREAF